MVKTPIIREPFSKIAIDIVGPLSRTKKGNKYILTVIDEGTRYPEAFPLPSIEAERIAQSLVQLFSRVGVARVILSDQGSNFTSTLLKQLYEMLGIKGITTSPYRPQSNGKCERYNGTLKKVLKKLCITYEKDWDEMLPYALFAYRETPHEETGFSPF
jgi:transposase InsO family protein